MKSAIETYLDHNANKIKLFWKTGNSEVLESGALQDHADYIYIRTLLGDDNWLCNSAVDKYANVISKSPISGRVGVNEHFLPHLSAYLLGSLNLLADAGFDVRGKVLSAMQLDLNLLIDIETFLPKWPKKWSHHTWRVSHWIGGIPSILLAFAKHGNEHQVNIELVTKVLCACDRHLIQEKTGLMKAYKSEALQRVFRLLYRLRHNPDHGDIGGLVHIHWINYVNERPYVAVDNLLDIGMEHMEKRPFFEKAPYCLDFDYVQLIRTSLEQTQHSNDHRIKVRMAELQQDLVAFFNSIPLEGYSLHKLPGALATLHEACLILDSKVPSFGTKPIDIIQKANWL